MRGKWGRGVGGGAVCPGCGGDDAEWVGLPRRRARCLPPRVPFPHGVTGERAAAAAAAAAAVHSAPGLRSEELDDAPARAHGSEELALRLC